LLGVICIGAGTNLSIIFYTAGRQIFMLIKKQYLIVKRKLRPEARMTYSELVHAKRLNTSVGMLKMDGEFICHKDHRELKPNE